MAHKAHSIKDFYVNQPMDGLVRRNYPAGELSIWRTMPKGFLDQIILKPANPSPDLVPSLNRKAEQTSIISDFPKDPKHFATEQSFLEWYNKHPFQPYVLVDERFVEAPGDLPSTAGIVAGILLVRKLSQEVQPKSGPTLYRISRPRIYDGYDGYDYHDPFLRESIGDFQERNPSAKIVLKT
jgi:hypothetical protein